MTLATTHRMLKPSLHLGPDLRTRASSLVRGQTAGVNALVASCVFISQSEVLVY